MINKDIDIINEVLEECILAFPVSSFIISLYKQYINRGWLTKKQLQGLHDKASQVEGLAPGKIATLQALINKMPNRYRSEAPANTPLYQKDESAGKMINLILEKYPQHKQVLFLQTKYENNETLTSTELKDLKRISEMIEKKSKT